MSSRPDGSDDPDAHLPDTKVLSHKRGSAPRARERGREDTLPVGSAAGAYVISRLIGTGGCGTVYEAEHRVIGRKVALKVLHRELADEPQLAVRFVQEARAVNLIRHPGIVDVHDLDTLDDGRPFYVMELVDGISLAALLEQRDPLTPLEALRILDPLCDALGAAHAKGVIHRDVKASNVIVVDRGPEWQVKLLDFGIAKILHPDPRQRGITTQEQRLGTPHYMAPEQLRGDPVDARTDVYALGVLLFRMLTQTYPFHSSNLIEIERMHLETPPPAPSQRRPVSPAIDAVVLRAMDKHPDRRFESAAAFQAALRLAADAPTAAPAAPGASQAIGIYVEVRVPDQHGELDQAVLSDLARMLDLAALVLGDAGFQLVLQTGTAILGARTSSPDALGETLAQGLRVTDQLFDALANRRDPDVRIRFNVCVHADRVSMQVAPDGKALLAGPLVQIGTWVPESDMPRVCVTEEVARISPSISAEAGARHYIVVRRAPG
jgi:tRNA A-37 threonylcarbamoyl transferase component Bud32